MYQNWPLFKLSAGLLTEKMFAQDVNSTDHLESLP